MIFRALRGCIAITACSIIFFGCSPQTRLTRLLKNHPYLISKQDTVIWYDTTIRGGSTVDTLFMGQVDTFYINDNRVTTRIIKNYDTVQVWQRVASDTLVYEKKVIEQIVPVKDSLPPYLTFGALVVFGCVLLVVVGGLVGKR